MRFVTCKFQVKSYQLQLASPSNKLSYSTPPAYIIIMNVCHLTFIYSTVNVLEKYRIMNNIVKALEEVFMLNNHKL